MTEEQIASRGPANGRNAPAREIENENTTDPNRGARDRDQGSGGARDLENAIFAAQTGGAHRDDHIILLAIRAGSPPSISTTAPDRNLRGNIV